MANWNNISTSASSMWNNAQTVSVTNIPVSTIDLGDFLNPLKPGFKKYEIIESEQDLLALAVARHRLHDTHLYHTLLDDTLAKQVTDGDRERAKLIRDHYQKKFVVWSLKGIELTPFRIELKELVHHDGLRFKDTMVPIAWKLPEFYDYDLEFEQLHHGFNMNVVNQDHETSVETKSLTLVKTLNLNTRRRKAKEFWFSDVHANLVYLPIERSNPLIGLLESVSKNPLTIKATYTKRSLDGREFLKARDLTFL